MKYTITLIALFLCLNSIAATVWEIIPQGKAADKDGAVATVIADIKDNKVHQIKIKGYKYCSTLSQPMSTTYSLSITCYEKDPKVDKTNKNKQILYTTFFTDKKSSRGTKGSFSTFHSGILQTYLVILR